MFNIHVIIGSVTLLLFALLCGYILLKTRMSYIIKFLLIPALFATVLLFLSIFQTSYGNPYYGYPANQFKLLNFRILNGGTVYSTSEYIELWVLENNNLDSRLFRIPYSEEIRKQLEQAKANSQKGRESKFKFEDGDSKAGPDLNGVAAENRKKLTVEFDVQTFPEK
jgi:hypothetical protein